MPPELATVPWMPRPFQDQRTSVSVCAGAQTSQYVDPGTSVGLVDDGMVVWPDVVVPYSGKALWSPRSSRMAPGSPAVVGVQPDVYGVSGARRGSEQRDLQRDEGRDLVHREGDGLLAVTGRRLGPGDVVRGIQGMVSACEVAEELGDGGPEHAQAGLRVVGGGPRARGPRRPCNALEVLEPVDDRVVRTGFAPHPVRLAGTEEDALGRGNVHRKRPVRREHGVVSPVGLQSASDREPPRVLHQGDLEVGWVGRLDADRQVESIQQVIRSRNERHCPMDLYAPEVVTKDLAPLRRREAVDRDVAVHLLLTGAGRSRGGREGSREQESRTPKECSSRTSFESWVRGSCSWAATRPYPGARKTRTNPERRRARHLEKGWRALVLTGRARVTGRRRTRSRRRCSEPVS